MSMPCRELQPFGMLLCRGQSELWQCLVYISCLQISELNDLMVYAFQCTPPTHNMAVWPVVIFAMTFKTRNPANRVISTDIWTLRQAILLGSSVSGNQKQGLSPQLLVSEQPYPYNPIHSVEWSTAQL
jgi:hypothetical protein